MEARLQKALAQQRQMYTRLEEAVDLTRQLGQAVDRDDPVSIRMLLSMRRQPVDQLLALRQSLLRLREEPPQEEGQRLADILNGAAAETEETAPLVRAAAANRRLTEQLLELDRAVNRKLGRGNSLYAQEAPPERGASS